jgi:hypothetical protein
MLALAALLLPLQAPLLPETPKDWRHERLEFPLSFAPDIELEGYEELRFAPGMFQRGSDTYFSYVLALRLEGTVEVDVPFLDSFLERYYRGLCQAVAEGRDLKLDLDAIHADVTRTREGFRAEIDLFDAFAAGEPLHLRLDLDVHARPRQTEILGLASPLPEDQPVWTELRSIRSRWLAARPAPLFLNHLFIVPDEATYAAIAGSEFLRTLAVFEERTTVRPDLTYTGLYFYGDHTYFEFLRPDASTGFAPGASGLALGFDRPDGSEGLARTLRERGVPTQLVPVSREIDGERVPWFRMLGLGLPSTKGGLTFFTMEYDPKFLAGWHADLPPAEGGVTRGAVLERYAAALGRGPGPMRDLVAVDLALEEDVRARLVEAGDVFGHDLERGEEIWTLRGPGIEWRLHPPGERPGIHGFEMALREEVEHEPMHMGRATLRFEGRSARFTFDR